MAAAIAATSAVVTALIRSAAVEISGNTILPIAAALLTEIETQQTGSAVSREETLSLTGSKVRETRLANKAAVSAARHDPAELAIAVALVTAAGLAMVLAVTIAAISEIAEALVTAAVVSEVATAWATAASATARQIEERLVATAAAAHGAA